MGRGELLAQIMEASVVGRQGNVLPVGLGEQALPDGQRAIGDQAERVEALGGQFPIKLPENRVELGRGLDDSLGETIVFAALLRQQVLVNVRGRRPHVVTMLSDDLQYDKDSIFRTFMSIPHLSNDYEVSKEAPSLLFSHLQYHILNSPIIF